MNNDTWTLGGREFRSRFILGSGKRSIYFSGIHGS